MRHVTLARRASPRLLFLVIAACSQRTLFANRTMPSRPPTSDTCTVDTIDPADAESLYLLPTDRITSVTVHGAAVEAGDVTLATKAGSLFDRDALHADLHALWRYGLAQRIAVTATRGLGGYAIAFDITPARRVIRVEFAGVTRAEIPRMSMLEGTLADRRRIAELVGTTEDLLRDHGYVDANLRATTRETCGGVIVRVTGALGRQYHVKTIRAIGATIPVSPADDLGQANVVGGVYWKSALDAARDRLVSRARALGHLDAKGELGVAFDKRTASVDVVMKISEGPRYRLRVVIEGGTPEMRALLGSKVAAVEAASDRSVEAARSDVVRVEMALDPQLAKLGGHVVMRFDRQGEIYVVNLIISALAPAGEPNRVP
jgi:outer membrane protein assembly factor BamA